MQTCPPGLLPLLVSVRRRLRLQAVFNASARAIVPAAAGAAVAVYLWRLGLLGTRGFHALVGAALAGVLVPGLIAALRRIPLSRAGKLVDDAHDLHDRVSSALAFAAEPEP